MKRLHTGVGADAAASTSSAAPAPGKRTLTESLPVQRRAAVPSAPAEDAQTTAARGVAGSGSALPFADVIADSFGPAHAETVHGISAHTGGAASEAAQDLGAHGYATGNAVAFAGAPDLHLAAHEAAHVVQQRQGVSLKGGVGAAGDAYEQHADAVADRVVAGQSAGDLLGGAITAASADHPMDAVQLQADGSQPQTISGNIISVKDNRMLGGVDVVIDRGSKDGVQHDMVIAFGKLYGAAPTTVTDHTVEAFVQGGSTKALKPGDAAIFTPPKQWGPLPPLNPQPAPSNPPPQPRPQQQPQSSGSGAGSAEYDLPISGLIASKTQDPNGRTCTVVLNDLSSMPKPGMTLFLTWLGGVIIDGVQADSYEVKGDTAVAHVTATLAQLQRCDSAAFI